ncbi:hypothetical protein CR513_57721, partial [Mucuna pruriens]
MTVMKNQQDELVPTRIQNTSVLHSAETKSNKSLLGPYQLSFCREQLGQCRDESILYTSDS